MRAGLLEDATAFIKFVCSRLLSAALCNVTWWATRSQESPKAPHYDDD
jgi:hypothetical protein